MSLVSEIPTTIKEIGYAGASRALANANYGPTLASIGQGVAAIPGQMRQQQADQQRLQMGALELSKAQREDAASKALNGAISNAIGPDGTPDRAKLGTLIKGTGAESAYLILMKELDALDESSARLREAKQKADDADADGMGRLAAAASKATDPHDQAAILAVGIGSRVKQGLMDQGTAHGILQNILGDDGQPEEGRVKGVIDQMIQASNEQRKLKTTEQQSQATIEERNATAAQKSAAAQTEAAQAVERQQTADTARRKDALTNYGRQLANARSKDAYTRAYNGVPPEYQNQFDAPDDWDAERSPEVARQATMTSVEIGTLGDKRADNARQAARDAETIKHDRALEAAAQLRATRPVGSGADTSVYSTENVRGYNEFQQNWKAHYPKTTGQYDQKTGEPLAPAPPPPSIEKWSVMTPKERLDVMSNPDARITDAEMQRRQGVGSATVAPSSASAAPSSAGVIVTKPGTTQRYKFPTQAAADKALKDWSAK